MKIIQAMGHEEGTELAAVATIADLVPVIGENRKILAQGLKNIKNNKGIAAIIEKEKVTTQDIAYQIAPKLNAAGRLTSPKLALKLLLSQEEVEIKNIAKELEKLNNKRKEIEKETFEKIEKIIEEKDAIIISGKYHAGIIGLTAAKLAEKYHAPTIIISEENEIAKGSCRSIPELHIKNALDKMSELFINYGGHSQAAGFSILTKNIPELKQKFTKYVKTQLKDEDYIKKIEIDEIISPNKITMKMAKEIEKCQPFGIGNSEPIFGCKNVNCTSIKIIGANKNHLSFMIGKTPAVAFGAANMASLLKNALVNIAYKIAIDEFSGKLKCYVIDIAPADEKIKLSRPLLKDIYKFLKNYGNLFDPFKIIENFNKKTGKNLSMNSLLDAFEIFQELGIMKIKENTYELPPVKKRNLNDSRTYRLCTS